MAVADDEFPVGADVDDQHGILTFLRRFHQHDTDVVPADETGFIGQCVNSGGRIDVNPQVAGPDVQAGMVGRYKRRHAQRFRIQPEQ